MHSKQYYCNWICKNRFAIFLLFDNDEKLLIRGGVEDTQLKAKAKVTKKIRGQGQGQPSRERPSRGQGQECSRARLRTKDTGASVLKKKKKGLQKSFSGNLQLLSVARIFGWGGPNYKSHAMTSSKIFKPGTFRGAKIS